MNIVLRTIIAVDKRTIATSQVTSNLSEVPGWLAGSSMSLSPWSVELSTPSGSVDLGEADYPIEVHHEFGESTAVTAVRLSRTLGAEELYVEVRPVSVSGTLFDMRVEFREVEE